MKKIMITAAAVAAFAFNSFGQFKVGLDVGPAFVTGGTSFGAAVNGKFLLNEKAAIGANLGYFTGNSYSLIPLTAAFDYYFLTEGFKPFVGAEAGFNITSVNTGYGISGSSTNLVLAPVAGFKYGITDQIDLGVTAKYYLILASGSATFVPITASVSYRFGK